jgi:hypothetical protein
MRSYCFLIFKALEANRKFKILISHRILEHIILTHKSALGFPVPLGCTVLPFLSSHIQPSRHIKRIVGFSQIRRNYILNFFERLLPKSLFGGNPLTS